MGKETDSVISVCVVVRNIHRSVADRVQRIAAQLDAHYQYYEVVIVDNHSTDGTDAQIQALQKQIANLRLLRLSRPHSDDTAFTAALESSIGDYVIMLDAEFDPPELIPELVKKAREGFDVVVVRHNLKTYYSGFDRRFATTLFRAASWFVGTDLAVDEMRYRLFSRRLVNAFTKVRRKRRYIKYFEKVLGYRHAAIQYEDHFKDTHPLRPLKRFESAATLFNIVISNSILPLRLASLAGLIASFLNLIYMGYVLIVALFYRNVVEGWITTAIMPTIMFFILFIIMAILTEYIAHLMQETRDEPLYFVEYETQSTVSTYSRIMEQEQLNVV